MNAHTRAEALRLLTAMNEALSSVEWEDDAQGEGESEAYFAAYDKLRALLSASDDATEYGRTIQIPGNTLDVAPDGDWAHSTAELASGVRVMVAAEPPAVASGEPTATGTRHALRSAAAQRRDEMSDGPVQLTPMLSVTYAQIASYDAEIKRLRAEVAAVRTDAHDALRDERAARERAESERDALRERIEKYEPTR